MRYFTLSEFSCKHCGENKMDLGFLAQLDELRHRCGIPFVITSGYRCPDHNAKVSSTGRNGPHTTGRAADIAIDRERAVRVLEQALAMPAFRGFGIQQKGTGRFLHLDACDRPARTIWSY